jgi:hypothetical protein
MKYLQKYEDFKRQEYTIGDLVKINNGEIAKIIEIPSKNSYIVNIMKNHAFVPEPIAVRDEDNGGLYIVDMIQSASNPAMGSDITQKAVTDPNNSMVINGGYPDTPLANTINY